MNCCETGENLSAYIDQALTKEEALAVEKHLESCPACRTELQELQKTVALLSSLEEVIPPARLRREIRTKLESYQAQEETKVKPSGLIEIIKKYFTGLSYRRLVPVAVVVALILVIIPLALQENMKMSSKDEARQNTVADASFTLKNTTKAKDNLKVGVASEEGKGGDGRAADTTTFYLADKAEMETPQASTPGGLPIPAPAPAPSDSPRVTIATTQKQAAAEPQVMDRKIIKNADISLHVENYQEAAEKLKDKVNAMGGYIANESVNVSGAEGGILNGHLSIRLPQNEFEPFLSGMDVLGNVKTRNIYSQDVSEEYVDVESRLNAMTVKEERLLSILEKSGNLSDILAVETELANTRAEKESMQGRLRYLNNRVELSTINLNITQVQASTQKISAGGLEGVLERAREAFVQAVNSIFIGLGKLIVLLSSAIPYLVLVALASLGIWLWVKKKAV